jgi:hypothetical protein
MPVITEAKASRAATLLYHVAKEKTSLWDTEHPGLCADAESLRQGVYDALYSNDGRKVGVATRKASKFMEKNRDAIRVLAEATKRDVETARYPEALRRSPCWGGWVMFLEWAGLSVD